MSRQRRPSIGRGTSPQRHAERGLAGYEWRASARQVDRKSTRLNSSHLVISYAVFCLKKSMGTCLLASRIQEYGPGKAALCNRNTGGSTLVAKSLRWLRPEHIKEYFFFLMIRRPPRSTLFPATALFR